MRHEMEALHLKMLNVFSIAALEAAMTGCDEWMREFNTYMEGNCKLVVDFI